MWKSLIYSNIMILNKLTYEHESGFRRDHQEISNVPAYNEAAYCNDTD